jgi:hypothetical protein
MKDGDIIYYQGTQREVLWGEGRRYTVVISDPKMGQIVVPIDRIETKGDENHGRSSR